MRGIKFIALSARLTALLYLLVLCMDTNERLRKGLDKLVISWIFSKKVEVLVLEDDLRDHFYSYSKPELIVKIATYIYKMH